MSLKKPFQSYKFKILWRLIAVILLAILAFHLITATTYWLLGSWVLLFVFFGIYNLLKLFEAYRRELTNFLTGIKQNDFTHSYSFVPNKNTELDLHQAYTTIIGTFKRLRQEKERNFHFLQTIVEHSNIPMLAYSELSDHIILYNEAAKNLFKRPFLKNIDALALVNPLLFQAVKKLKSGERELVNTSLQNELLQLSVNVKALKLEEERIKLVSFQNIKNELDQKELEAWQKLIRVLTHEIKNSAIPISTLTEVVGQMIMSEKGELKDLTNLGEEESEDLKIGLKTVEKRSKGLVKFVNAYGQLAKLPQPQLQPFQIEEVVNSVLQLLKNDLEKAKVSVQIELEPYTLQIDATLIEQLLINLIKNAKEALIQSKDPLIILTSALQGNQYLLYIHDNGQGMDDELLQNIFTPFFTTKKEGSGIGLSLSKQIMLAHKGQISVNSSVGQGTTFLLAFKAD